MATSVAEKAAQAQANNVVYPLPRPTDGTKAWRLEIDEFIADNAVTNLFLLALSEMQVESLTQKNTKDSNWWSFYSLAGIHGQPRESWAGAGNQGRYGYCHHGMTTFPTWHRAYMFQMEQAVYNKMVQIANRYTGDDKKMYVDATSRFRLPYWDIAMPRHKDDSNASPNAKKGNAWFWGLPDILKTPTVYVRYPDSPKELKTMANPLYQFTFPDAKAYSGTSRTQIPFKTSTFQGWQIAWNDKEERFEKVDGSFDEKCPNLLHTVRGPTVQFKGDSDYGFLDESVQLQTRETTTYLWQLLTPVDAEGKSNKANQLRSWNFFASHAQISNNETWEEMQSRSIESWHDNIHGMIGTGQSYAGHMGNPAIAAFDPIFWLHHNNIERLFCLYQSLYPDKYVSPGKRDEQKPPVPKNDLNIFADDQLYPFVKDASSRQCFTSTDLRDWTKCGYATPGDKNDPGVPASVAQYLRDTYYWATNKSSKPNFEKLKYPKDLSHVEALTGKPEPMNSKPQVFMKAISVQGGTASLVSRAMALTPGVKAEDHIIKAASVEKELKQSEQDFPEGALIDAEKDTETKMSTWNAHFRIKKYAYDGSFNIHFFIGDIESARPDHYMVRMNEVGFSGIFATSSDAACAQCEKFRDLGLKYEDVVPLTNTLTDYLERNPTSDGLITHGSERTIRDLSPEQVVPFLKENLRWRMTNTSGQPLPYLPGSELQVVVAGRIFVPPHGDNMLGAYQRARVYGDITTGKNGGYTGPDFDMS